MDPATARELQIMDQKFTVYDYTKGKLGSTQALRAGGKSGSQNALNGSAANLAKSGSRVKDVGGATAATQETALASSFRDVMEGRDEEVILKEVGGASGHQTPDGAKPNV